MSSDSEGGVLVDEIAGALAAALAPVAPAAERAAAVKSRVLDRVRGDRSGFVTVHACAGRWVPIAPGVQSKVLHDDGRTRSFLLKLEPGARLPAHGHAAEEACVVLEGAVQLGDLEVRAGDFHLALAGSVHGEVTTRTGALLFLRT